MEIRRISTDADVAAALAEPLAVVYKHSPICPSSDLAYQEIRSLRRVHHDVPVYLVDVIQFRPLSRRIAEQVGVQHASPQAIILRGGVPAWHASHYDLRADTLAERIQSLKTETDPGLQRSI